MIIIAQVPQPPLNQFVEILAALFDWSPREIVRAWDEPARESVTRTVAQIQRADYEGNRAEFRRHAGAACE